MSESEWETDTDPPTDDESVNNTSAATAGQDTPTTGIKIKYQQMPKCKLYSMNLHRVAIC